MVTGKLFGECAGKVKKTKNEKKRALDYMMMMSPVFQLERFYMDGTALAPTLQLENIQPPAVEYLASQSVTKKKRKEKRESIELSFTSSQESVPK